MSKIKEIYSTLCLFSVFRNLLSTPVFKAFIEYCEEENKNEKPKKYGALVSEIYKNGGSLTECVKKALYEDENVYVRAVAKGEKINPNIEKSVKYELDALNELAGVSSDSFALDMGIAQKSQNTM